MIHQNRRHVAISFLLFIIIALPIYKNVFSKEGNARFSQVSIFSDTEETNKRAIELQQQYDSFISHVIFNRRVIFIQQIVGNFFTNLNPQFLFLSGDSNGRHGPRDMGVLYMWEIPFILLGIISLLLMRSKLRFLVLAWIIIAIIPASISLPAPHALRTLTMLPMPQLLTAIGIVVIFTILKKNIRYGFIVLLTLCATYFSFLYLQNYYFLTVKKTNADWGDGYKQLTQYIIANENSYNKIIISGHYWQPYMYFLFYKQYSPSLFQQSGTSERFDKYQFGGTSWDKDKTGTELDSVNLKQYSNVTKVLVALSQHEYETQKSHVKRLAEIKNHNNETVFIVGEIE